MFYLQIPLWLKNEVKESENVSKVPKKSEPELVPEKSKARTGRDKQRTKGKKASSFYDEAILPGSAQDDIDPSVSPAQWSVFVPL